MENIYKNSKIGIAIELDEENKTLSSFGLTDDGKVNYSTKGTLMEINIRYAKDIESFFSIDLKSCNVEIVDNEVDIPFAGVDNVK